MAARAKAASLALRALLAGAALLGLSQLYSHRPAEAEAEAAAPPAQRIDLAGGRRLEGGREVRSLLNVAGRLHYGDYRWNEQDVPEGKVWVRIDLRAQTLSIFRAGHEIGTAVILYGQDGMPTPKGTFPIIEKRERHRSSLYEADMPYMLRLTMDGVAIHASAVRAGAATHGCVGVPIAFAERLFRAVRRGDEVVVIG